MSTSNLTGSVTRTFSFTDSLDNSAEFILRNVSDMLANLIMKISIEYIHSNCFYSTWNTSWMYDHGWDCLSSQDLICKPWSLTLQH